MIIISNDNDNQWVMIIWELCIEKSKHRKKSHSKLVTYIVGVSVLMLESSGLLTFAAHCWYFQTSLFRSLREEYVQV